MLGLGLVFLLGLALGLLPYWPYSREWGFAPSATCGLVLMGLIGLLRLAVAV
ncbi:MAG: DUF3309 family protein [Gemmatimonadota bacterium]